MCKYIKGSALSLAAGTPPRCQVALQMLRRRAHNRIALLMLPMPLKIRSLKNALQLDFCDHPDINEHQAHSKRLSSMGAVVVRIPQYTEGVQLVAVGFLLLYGCVALDPKIADRPCGRPGMTAAG